MDTNEVKQAIQTLAEMTQNKSITPAVAAAVMEKLRLLADSKDTTIRNYVDSLTAVINQHKEDTTVDLAAIEDAVENLQSNINYKETQLKAYIDAADKVIDRKLNATIASVASNMDDADSDLQNQIDQCMATASLLQTLITNTAAEIIRVQNVIERGYEDADDILEDEIDKLKVSCDSINNALTTFKTQTNTAISVLQDNINNVDDTLSAEVTKLWTKANTLTQNCKNLATTIASTEQRLQLQITTNSNDISDVKDKLTEQKSYLLMTMHNADKQIENTVSENKKLLEQYTDRLYKKIQEDEQAVQKQLNDIKQEYKKADENIENKINAFSYIKDCSNETDEQGTKGQIPSVKAINKFIDDFNNIKDLNGFIFLKPYVGNYVVVINCVLGSQATQYAFGAAYDNIFESTYMLRPSATRNAILRRKYNKSKWTEWSQDINSDEVYDMYLKKNQRYINNDFTENMSSMKDDIENLTDKTTIYEYVELEGQNVVKGKYKIKEGGETELQRAMYQVFEIDPSKKYVTSGLYMPNNAWSLNLYIYYNNNMQVIGYDQLQRGPFVADKYELKNIPLNCKYVALNSCVEGKIILEVANDTEKSITDISNEVAILSNKVDSKEKLLKVTKTGNTLWIRTRLNDTEDIVIEMGQNDNGSMTFKKTGLGNVNDTEIDILTNKVVHNWNDSTAPLLISNYEPWHLFMQHGYHIPVIVAENHGLTKEDIGGTEWWEDNKKRKYKIGKISGNKIFLLPRVTGPDTRGIYSRDWKSISAETTEITLITRDSKTINADSVETYQIKSIQESKGRTFLADGTSITEDGTYFCNDMIITETVVGTNVFKITQWFDDNGNDNPVKVSDMAEITQTFHWNGMTCRYDTSLNIKEPLMFNAYGANQGQLLMPISTLPGYEAYTAIPRVKGREVPKVITQSINIYRNNNSLFDKNKLYDRAYCILKNGNDEKIGFAAGVSLVKGMSNDEKRINRTAEGRFIGSVTKLTSGNKCYFRIITGEDENNMLTKEFVGNFSTYFSYFNPMENEGKVFWYKDGNNYIVYAHYNKSSEKSAINLPSQMEGLKSEVIEKSNGMTLLTDAVTNGKLFVSANEDTNNEIIIKL